MRGKGCNGDSHLEMNKLSKSGCHSALMIVRRRVRVSSVSHSRRIQRRKETEMQKLHSSLKREH